MLGTKFKLNLDVAGVMARVQKKRNRVLFQTGGYALSVMRRSIRPPKGGRKSRTVVVDGQELFVPIVGKVLDAKTKRPVNKNLADAARQAMLQRLRHEGAGQPPRRGPTDALRPGMNFQVDQATESVVIGAKPFAKQPPLVGAVSVPQLLEDGGSERIGSKFVKYNPRPFVKPAMQTTKERMHSLIEKTPL